MHLYVVDIEFDHKNATENQITYNEIDPPIIEKQKIIDPCERHVYQLLGQYSTTDKGNRNHIKQPRKLMRQCFKKIFSRCISNKFSLL